jgi:hypothetical protein
MRNRILLFVAATWVLLAGASPGNERIIIVCNESNDEILLASILLSNLNTNEVAFFVGNLAPGTRKGFSVTDKTLSDIDGIEGLVNSRHQRYLFAPPTGLRVVSTPIQQPITWLRITAPSHLEIANEKEQIASGKPIELTTAIPNLELNEITRSEYLKPLPGIAKMDERLRRLASSPLRLTPHAKTYNTPELLTVYSIAYLNGWYASLLGDISSSPLILTDIWYFCETYAPKNEANPTSMGHRETLVHRPFDKASATDNKKTDPFTEKLRNFQDAVFEAFLEGHKAGLSILGE